MLKRTFCHIDGVSSNTEKLLWENGICSWDEFIKLYPNIGCISESKAKKVKSELYYSYENISKGNLSYFKDKLSPKEFWRLVGHGKICFLDIETTGLSRYTDEITLIGIYDGMQSFIYLNGRDLEMAAKKLEEFDIVVTFNGKQFDLPFIEHKFSKKYDLFHLDLRFMLKEYGYKGGLKKIEKELGIKRDDVVANIDGFEAVRLWRRYKQGDNEALNLLLKYNEEDIVNLKYILDYYLNRKYRDLEEFGFYFS